MKNLAFILILCLIIISSCTKEDLKYSCDPEINAIVKSGEIEFSEIELTEFLEYDIILQKAIYRSLTNDKKRNLWLEKLDLIISGNELNDNEMKHIKTLAEHISNINFVFQKLDSIQFKQRKNFEDEWVNYAKNILLWDDFKVHFVVNSLCIKQEQYKQIIEELTTITLNVLSGSCGCSTESDYCSDRGGRCDQGGCSQTSGCGFLWQYQCDGVCQ